MSPLWFDVARAFLCVLTMNYSSTSRLSERSRGGNRKLSENLLEAPRIGLLSQESEITFVIRIELGSCHKRQKPQAPTPQAPIRNRQTRKVASAKGLNCNTNLT